MFLAAYYSLQKMKTSIFFHEMQFFAYHGVLEQERMIGNTFLVSLKIDAALSEACHSDKIIDTINYAEVYAIVKKEMETPANLLEHLATRILKKLKQRFSQILFIEVRVEKPNPPISGQIGTVGVNVSE